jgi:hypothetical protein
MMYVRYMDLSKYASLLALSLSQVMVLNDVWHFLTGDLIHLRQKRPQPHVLSASSFSLNVNSSVLGVKTISHTALQQ